MTFIPWAITVLCWAITSASTYSILRAWERRKRKPKIAFSSIAALDLTLPPAHTNHVHVGIPHQDFGASDYNYTQVFSSQYPTEYQKKAIEHKHALENALFFGSKAYSASSSNYPYVSGAMIEWLDDTFMPKTALLEKTIEANDRNNGTWQPTPTP